MPQRPAFARLLPALAPLGTLALFACTTTGTGAGENVEVPATANYTPTNDTVVSVADAAPRKPRFSPYVVIHNTRSPYKSPVPTVRPSSSTASPTPDPGATAPQYLGNLNLLLLGGGSTGAPADGTASGTPKSILRTDPGTGTHPGALGLAVKATTAFEAEEVVFIDGIGGGLRRFNPTTGQVTTFAAPIGDAVGQLGGLAYDPTSKAYYASDLTLRRIYKITLPDGVGSASAPVAALIAGDPAATAGQAAGAVVDAAGTAARFGEPRGLCLIGQALFVADAGAHLIRRIDLSTGSHPVTTVAGSSTGKPTNLDEDVAATSAQFNAPSAIAGTASQGLFIADQKNHLIRKLDLTTSKVTVLCGTGKGLAVDGARGTADFNEPLGLAISSTHLFVAERSARLRAINLSSRAAFTALGSNAPGVAVGLKESAAFVNPLAIAPLLDAAGAFKSLYVLDGGNGQASLGARLVKFTGTL